MINKFTTYFYQDLSYIIISVVFIAYLFGYAEIHRRIPKGFFLLLLLTLLLSTGGLSDMVFRWNPDPTLVILADSLNVFCFSFALTIILHYSALYFYKNDFLAASKGYRWLYLPACLLTFVYILSPLMIKGIVSNPIGFQLKYAPGYWLIVLFGALLGLAALLINFGIVLHSRNENEKNRSLFMLFVLILTLYFYSSVMFLPFLFNAVNFASPLPMTFAVIVLVYAYIKYGYFIIEPNG
jgi:hypothetical protein